MSRSIKDYIEDRLGEELAQIASDFVDEHTDLLEEKMRQLHVVGEYEIDETVIAAVFPKRKENCRLFLDIGLKTVVILHEGDYHYDEEESVEIWCSVKGEGDLSKGLEDFVVSSVGEYRNRSKELGVLSDALVPVWGSEKFDYDAEAERFLQKYYPEALEEPMLLDPDQLVKRMGLTKLTHHISRDCSVFGQIYFEDVDDAAICRDDYEPDILAVQAGTIIVDPDVFFLRNLGAQNNTVVHECVHWEYHRNAVELERQFDTKIKNIDCCVVGGIRGHEKWSNSDIVEYQANRLAPCIQMPSKTFMAKAEEIIHAYGESFGTEDSIEVMEDVIADLAEFFGVSKMAAKIRLCQLGVEEARGTFIWLDEHYVPAHSWKKGFLENKQTFSIDSKNLALLFARKLDFRKGEEIWNFVYVESHLVLNIPRFVDTSSAGNPMLTDYARKHMDECAVVFDMELEGGKVGEYQSMCFLNRGENNGIVLDFNYGSGLKKGAPTGEEVKAMLMKSMRFLAESPHDFTGLMTAVRKRRKMTVDEIAEETYMSEKTVRRIFRGETHDIKKLTMILLSMQTPSPVSQEIMRLGGYAFPFTATDFEIPFYQMLLANYWGHTMEDIIAFMRQAGINLNGN